MYNQTTPQWSLYYVTPIIFARIRKAIIMIRAVKRLCARRVQLSDITARVSVALRVRTKVLSIVPSDSRLTPAPHINRERHVLRQGCGYLVICRCVINILTTALIRAVAPCSNKKVTKRLPNLNTLTVSLSNRLQENSERGKLPPKAHFHSHGTYVDEHSKTVLEKGDTIYKCKEKCKRIRSGIWTIKEKNHAHTHTQKENKRHRTVISCVKRVPVTEDQLRLPRMITLDGSWITSTQPNPPI